MKRNCYGELSYLAGMLMLCLGVYFLLYADFGMSVVVAPAYLIHLKLSTLSSFFTFGTCEYLIQAGLFVLLCLLLRRFSGYFLFAYASSVFYGTLLNLTTWLLPDLPMDVFALRIVYFVLGMVLCAMGVAFTIHSYLPPQVYELFLKECALHYNLSFGKMKWLYDGCSCLLAVLLSMVFFGFYPLRGIGVGTVVATLCNGYIVGKISQYFAEHVEFSPRFPQVASYIQGKTQKKT